MITRQQVFGKNIATIQTHILIALKEGLVVQWWYVMGQLFVQMIVVTFGADNGGDFEFALDAGAGIDAAVEVMNDGAVGVLHHV